MLWPARRWPRLGERRVQRCLRELSRHSHFLNSRVRPSLLEGERRPPHVVTRSGIGRSVFSAASAAWPAYTVQGAEELEETSCCGHITYALPRHTTAIHPRPVQLWVYSGRNMSLKQHPVHYAIAAATLHGGSLAALLLQSPSSLLGPQCAVALLINEPQNKHGRCAQNQEGCVRKVSGWVSRCLVCLEDVHTCGQISSEFSRAR